MKNLIIYGTAAILFFVFCNVMDAQENKVNPGIHTAITGYGMPESKQTRSNIVSAEVDEVSRELLAAKESGNQSLAMQFQARLDQLTHSVTKAPDMCVNGFVLHSANPPFVQSDNTINIIRVLERSSIKGIAVVTEQRGAGAGKLWVVAGIGGQGSAPDTLWIYSSTDNGASWVQSGGAIDGGYAINYDEVDAEIIEDNSGTKYLWTVYGETKISDGSAKIGLVISTSNTIFLGSLGWPNSGNNVKFYRPRITSDNAFWSSGNAWIYITACRDSLRPGLGNTIVTTEWAARCNNPYTVSPSITYKPDQFGYSTSMTASQTLRDFADIAYYRNGNADSIIVTESDLPDSTSIYLMRTSISNFVNGGSYYTAGSLQGSARWKSHGRIASNGGYPNLMIVCDESYTNADWDIPYFSSVAGSSSWSTNYVDFRSTYEFKPDITGRRNIPGTFYCAYTGLSIFDSVTSRTATNNTWGPYIEPINHIDASYSCPPKPGFRFVNNDSCLTIWSQYSGNTNIWASNGCTPPIISGINSENNNIPRRYTLEQNYPNPFNPVTLIKFGIPKSSFVNLTVYDINGKLTRVLIDKNLEAGNYTISFNASELSTGVYFYRIEADGFAEVKKMVLIK